MALRNPEQIKLLKKKKKHKFNAHPVEVWGQKFHSTAEAARYIENCERKKRGEITNLKRQVPYQFKCGAKYIADFTYYEQREGGMVFVVEDTKGVETPLYRRNRQMLLHEFGLVIREIKMNADAADALVKAAQHTGGQ